jgi:thioredoxin 1
MSTKEITSNEIFEEVTREGVSLIDFNAPWCGPCNSQKPIIDNLANRLKDRAVIGEIDIDNQRELALGLGIRSIPTLIIYKSGKELQRFVGLQSEDELSSALEKALQ